MSVLENPFSAPSVPKGYSELPAKKIGDSLVMQIFSGPQDSDPVYTSKVYVKPTSIMASLSYSENDIGNETIFHTDRSDRPFLVEQTKWNWNGEESFSVDEMGGVKFTFSKRHVVSTNQSGALVTLQISPDDDLSALEDRHKDSLIAAFRNNYDHSTKNADAVPTLQQLRTMLDRIDQNNAPRP